jgi:ELWxxDGT repeat protein
MNNLRSRPIVARLLACLLLVLLASPSSPPSTAAQPRAAAPLLIDINPGAASSYPFGFVTIGDLVYFSANDGVHGNELWRSDGTPAGTWMVKDMTPGAASTPLEPILAFNGTLFSLVYGGDPATTRTVELWRSDGTSAGTIPLGQVGAWSSLFEVCSFSVSPFGENIVITKNMETIQPCNESVTVHSGLAGGMLWSKPGSSSETTTLAGRSYFFFSSQDASTPSGLWASAGSPAGVAYVDSLPTNGWIRQLRASDGAFYFSSVELDRQGSQSSTLWKSTGAPGGISMIKDFPDDQVIFSSAVFSQSLIFAVAGTYYTNTLELWRSDGTPASTQPIRRLASAPRGVGLNRRTSHIVRIGDRLAFDGPATCDPATDSYSTLWVTDGLAPGTGVVAPALRIKDPSDPEISGGTVFMQPYGDQIVFLAKDAAHGVEPWISDGTVAGTRLLADLAPGAASSDSHIMATLPGKFLANVYSDSSGYELWVVDIAAPPPVPPAGPYRLYLPLAASSLLCSTP